MLNGTNLHHHFERLGTYCLEIESRSHQTLYFDVQPFASIAQHTFYQLTAGGYIEHIGSTTWRFTKYGAYRLINAQNVSESEWNLSCMLYGFLVGVFNGDRLNDHCFKPLYSSWQTILYPCIRELVDETAQITNGSPSIPHNKDFCDIVKSIAIVTDLKILEQNNDTSRAISFELRDHTGDLSIFFSAVGIVLGVMI